MTLPGIHGTAQSLRYYARLQEVTANNLANVSTDGFKMDRLTAAMSADGTFPVPVEATDLRQGALRETGRDLDIALEGDGFVTVQTPAGERLTRGGSLRLDAAGMLVDNDGNPLLGIKGPIIVPPGRIEIARDGAIAVDGAPLDQLRLVTVPDPSTLKKEGAGRFVTPAKTEPADFSLTVRQGSIEEPNTDPVLGMVDLVTIQRAYTANLDALKAMDGVLGSLTSEVGKL
jgi:flagellar basal body rod protein FlgG